jgi:TRAP transporter TAXI family solute receptor
LPISSKIHAVAAVSNTHKTKQAPHKAHGTHTRRTDYATDHVRLTMWQKLKRFDFLLLTHKEMRLLLLLALALSGVVLWLLFSVISPPPPKLIRISAGSESGAYYKFAKTYAEQFKKHGITLEVLTSKGSVENLTRLNDKAQKVDLAFVQGGIADAEQYPKLESLASVAYEPIWVFYNPRSFNNKLNHLSELAGKTIAVGTPGSGVRAVALEFLKLNQISETTAKLIELSGTEAVEAVAAGTVDAVFLVTAVEAPSVQRAIDKGVAIYSFSQAEAYARKFPWSAKVTLPKGGAIMAKNLPAEDVELVAATANLVARADLHQAIMFLALDIASEVHRLPSPFSAVGDFPNKRNLDFTQSDESKRFFETGRPFLQRYVPFWLANLIERFLVLLGPLIAIAFPIMKLGPALLSWNEQSELAQIYDEVLDIEYGRHPNSDSLDKALARLAEIEASIPHLGLTAHYYTNIYSLRGHLATARRNLMDRSGATAAQPGPHTEHEHEE